MISLEQPLAFADAKHSNVDHPLEDLPGRSALFSLSIPGCLFDERPGGIAMPYLIRTSIRELSDLLTPRTQVGNVASVVSSANAIQPASLVRNFIQIRSVKNGKLFPVTQRWKPLRRVGTSAAMMFVVEVIKISASLSGHGMDRS